jgi:hypothetical protein
VQAGIVVRDGRDFRFFAAADAFYPLERQTFKNPKAAEDAALRRCLGATRRTQHRMQYRNSGALKRGRDGPRPPANTAQRPAQPER